MPRPLILTRCGQLTHPTSESVDGASTTFTVMDDFSRFIIAWRLQTDMASDSFIEVVQDAVDLTGMTDVSWEHRAQGYFRTTGQAISLIPSENTCGWWASVTYWLRPSILRPTANWSGITGPLNLTSTRSHTMFQETWRTRSRTL